MGAHLPIAGYTLAHGREYAECRLIFAVMKNIIFDFGGVLVDWNPRHLYRDIFRDEEAMEHFLATICTDEWNLEQDRGRSLAEGTAWLQQRFPEEAEHIALFYGQWETMMKGDIPEHVALLRELKATGRYGLYGLTNWSSETFPLALKRFSFFGLFDGIVVSGEERLVKPDKALFQRLVDRYALVPEQSLFIDDNAKNIAAARAMGFHTVHCVPDIDLRAALQAQGVL